MLRQRSPQQQLDNSDSDSSFTTPAAASASSIDNASTPSRTTSKAAPASSPIASSSSTIKSTDLDDPSQPLLQRSRTRTAKNGSRNSDDNIGNRNNQAQGQGDEGEDMDLSQFSRKTQWMVLAVASGACAAFNGVFAKLTTTELTSGLSQNIAHFFGLGSAEVAVEVIVRGTFFVLNLIFNGIMWALFTKALARGTSTTQVSILNTSSNFMITAIVGFILFSESLPPLWWLGAAFLVAGNVIIGRREEKDPVATAAAAQGAAEGGLGLHAEEEEGLIGEELEMGGSRDARKRSEEDEEEDDILDLGADLLDGFSHGRPE